MNGNDGHVRPPDTTKHESPGTRYHKDSQINAHGSRATTNNESSDMSLADNDFQINNSIRSPDGTRYEHRGAPKEPFFSTKKPSISLNLTLSLVGFIFLLSTLFVVFYYFESSRSAERQLEKKADEYIDSVAGTLAVPLWDVDRENINVICNAFIQSNWVVRVKLTGISGEIMFDRHIAYPYNSSDVTRRSRELFYGEEPIGRLEIALSAFESRKDALRSLKVVVVALLICMIGLVVFTGFLFKKIIKEPLEALGRIAKAYEGGEFHPQIDVIPYREFEPLVSILVEMGETIEIQMNELKAAELFLKRHRDDLEETVAERTRSLARSNEKLQREIARRQKAQETLREKDRLQGVLELSGAVSHEMTQPLMSVMGYFDLMQMDMSESDPNFQRIRRIREQLERMSGITKKLMEISRYETKAYLDGQIVDLSKSSEHE